MKRIFLICAAALLLVSMTACMKDSASVGVIGGADGPTAVFVTE